MDKVLASVFAVLDYGAFNESPINAILSALGGVIGYSAGFSIGAPFGGLPGLVTGAAGSIAGDFVAKQMLKLLYKTPGLKNIDDPIAKSLNLTPRKIIRDPDSELPSLDMGGPIKDNMIKIPKKVNSKMNDFANVNVSKKTMNKVNTELIIVKQPIVKRTVVNNSQPVMYGSTSPLLVS